VEPVVSDDRAVLDAEGVNSAHVAQNRSVAVAAFADVMDMVELNDVAPCQRASIAPSPTDADARVEKVGDFVVGDAVAVTLPDPNPDGAVEHPTPVTDDAIGHFVAESLLPFVVADLSFADFDAPCSQVKKLATDEAIFVTTPRKFHAVGAEVGNRATFKNAMADAFAVDGAWHFHGRLRKAADFLTPQSWLQGNTTRRGRK